LPMVAARLDWKFVDADDVIEAESGASIAQIFARDGESAFRDREHATIARLAGTDGLVLALGGGAIEREATRDLLLTTPGNWRTVASYLPFSQEGADLVAHRFRQVTEATLLGTALTSILQGTAVALGFWLTGLGAPWFWGVVTAIVSVLPLFGSALVWFPGAVALAVQGRYGAAVVLAAIGAIVASNIDNVMRPLVNRRVSNLHPMTTLVGAFAGAGVLGLAGILLGPLAITYFFELAALYRREYMNGRDASLADPTDTSEAFTATRR